MGILEKWGLVEKEDTSKEKVVSKDAPKKKTNPSSSPTNTTSTYVAPTTFAQSAGVTVDSSEFNDYLQKVFTERNFPGPDYYEFVEGLKKMQTVALDEQTKFITLFTGLSVAGLTKEKLIETALKYIDIVNEQQTAFNAEVDATLKTEVGAKEQQMQTFVNENQEIEQQMIALTEKKNKNAIEISRIAQEVGADRQTLQLKAQSFDSAVKIFVNAINENIAKIQKYITQ